MIDLSVLDRHQKVALSFSGGKDSLAVVYLLRGHLDRVTLYHLDTGDLLSETREIVAHVKAFAPNFVHIQGDVLGWIKQHGLPSDLVPYSSHPVGVEMEEPARVRLVPRYDCCWENLMRPIYERVRADGNTLLIRGTKAIDMHRLPVRSGEVRDGVEFWYPLESWTTEQVFEYLISVGAPISRVYTHTRNSPECARCTAWLSESRAVYLRRYHPDLFNDYRSRLELVAAELDPVGKELARELRDAFSGGLAHGRS